MIVKNLPTCSQFATLSCVLLSLRAITKIMKNTFTLFFSLLFAFSASAQTSVSKTTSVSTTVIAPTKESITLKETEYDFGKIPQGKPVTHIFEFTNTGDSAFALD